MKLSIIIPVYNEAATIEKILGQVFKVKLPVGVEKEVIAIDDGSRDRTPQILKKLKKNNVKIIVHKENKGKGAAVRSGLSIATGDIFIIQDADLEYNPNDFNKLLKPILNKEVKVVYGTRLKNYPLVLWGKNRTPHPTHWLGNKFLSLFTNLLYGSNLTDMETCYKVFTKEVLQSFKLVSNRFEIEPEITSKILRRGFQILEVPIKTTPRSYFEGKKIHWYDGLGALWTLIKFRLESVKSKVK